MSAGDVDVTTRGDVDKLKGNAVGLYSILFLCVTGSAPLAVFIYNTPFTMPYGSGSNGPGTFFFATIVLTIFSIAYAEMAKKVRAAGGMYTYVSHGLGQAWGLMAGYSLMIGYAIFGVALLGGFSSFAQAKWLQYDVHVNWLWFALIGVALVVCLAYFDVEISARVLGRRADQRDRHHRDLLDLLLRARARRRGRRRSCPGTASTRESRPGSRCSSRSGRGSASRPRRTTPRRPRIRSG